MEAQIPSPTQCSICNNATTMRCGSCNSSTYCSAECQKLDWPVHKLLCRQFRDLGAPPTGLFRRGILFPVDQKKPKFVWVPYTVYTDSKGYREDLHTTAFVPDREGVTGVQTINRNESRSRRLGQTLKFIAGSRSCLDGSPMNICIDEVTKGNRKSNWRGPVVLMKTKGPSGSTRGYGDVDMVDFRDAVDHFATGVLSADMNSRIREALLKRSGGNFGGLFGAGGGGF